MGVIPSSYSIIVTFGPTQRLKNQMEFSVARECHLLQGDSENVVFKSTASAVQGDGSGTE